MRTRRCVGGLVLLACLAAGAPASANDNRYIVRIKPGYNGISAINLACGILDCNVLRSLDGDPTLAPLQPGFLFLVDSPVPIPLGSFLTWVMRVVIGIDTVEPDLKIPLLETQGGPLDQIPDSHEALSDYLWRRDPADYYGTNVWEGYLQQPAVTIVRLRDTQCAYTTSGAGLVAIIDTGVDSTHPVLAPVLQWGYDFTRNSAGGDEKADVTQESAAMLDERQVYRVNQESAAMLDQESAAMLDNPNFPAFGHGTMVAGVVHLVAPTADIMPLKAFSADGTGYLSDILRAINQAVRKGARVINMSFSRPSNSPELKRALDQAAAAGAIAISSAGNDGQQTLRWPAALDNVIGVASTSNADQRSTFSNYGPSLVWMAAPGEGVITTYPFGTYAATWGTSFSTPFASGATALFVGMRSALSQSEASWALAQAEPVSPEVGWGRLDLYKAVGAGRLFWLNVDLPDLSESCGLTAIP